MRTNMTEAEKRTYTSWAHMKDRCDNPKFSAAQHYSGKGITYERDWKNFDNFVRDLGLRPEGTSLERRDGNVSYTAANCYWATKTEQNRNTSRNVMTLEVAKCIRQRYNEEGLTMGRLATIYGTDRHVVRSIVRNVCWL